jgi:ribonuclease-3
VKEIDILCPRIGYSFTRRELLVQALTHRSYGKQNNERLEFLGDSVLNLIISELLYDRYPDVDEGTLSRLRAGLVNGETLGSIALTLDLGDYLLLGPGELKSGGHTRSSIQADALEAIFGAVYLDGGYEASRNLVLSLYSKQIKSINPDRVHKDPKTRLQEYLQSRQMRLPAYEIESVTGKQHKQTFKIECRVEDLDMITHGTGRGRKSAEQQAAMKMLKQIEADERE